MKSSVVTSAVLHVMVLVWAMTSFSAPESFKVEDFEAMPVDLVPVEEMTQMQQGDKTAPPKEKAAPKPTQKPSNVPNAENMGENKIDLKTPPVPNAKPSNNESAAAPKAAEKPLPDNDPVPNEVKDVAKEETDVAPKEVASIPPPKPDVTPTPPKPEEPPKDETPPPKPEAEALPDNVPVPAAKPQVKPPEEKPVEKPPEKKPDEQKVADKPAEKTDKKIAEKKQEKAKASSSKQSDFNADDIAALLNKQDPSNGGAKSSTETASLGAKKSTVGSKLSMSEMDALKNAIAGNWSVIPGMEGASDIRVKVTIELDQDGNIVGEPQVETTGGSNAATARALEGGAYRAVMKSAPFKNLPRDKYDAWSEVVINFDPSDLAL